MGRPIIIDGLENERICMEYLKSLEVKVDGNYRFIGHKHLIQIESVDSFHQIAQSANISELRNIHGSLDFILDVPNAESKIPEHWTVLLPYEQTRDFLSKYQEKYRINRKK